MGEGVSGRHTFCVIPSTGGQAFSHLALIEAAARIMVAELMHEYRSASSFSGSSGGGGGIRIHERPDGP